MRIAASPPPVGEGMGVAPSPMSGIQHKRFLMKHLARDLRRNQTDAEKLVWSRLRNRQLEGRKFRRQQIIGPYIADFLCLEPKLIVELDGGQHMEQQDSDAARTAYLSAMGYRVLRFWNNEAISDIEAVLERIRQAIISTS